MLPPGIQKILYFNLYSLLYKILYACILYTCTHAHTRTQIPSHLNQDVVGLTSSHNRPHYSLQQLLKPSKIVPRLQRRRRIRMASIISWRVLGSNAVPRKGFTLSGAASLLPATATLQMLYQPDLVGLTSHSRNSPQPRPAPMFPGCG